VRTVLSYVTQTLAAYEIALSKEYVQAFTDGTSRRQTFMQNFILRLSESGFRQVTLSGCIIAEDESSETVARTIMKVFKEAGDKLDHWRRVTEELYPHRADLLEAIPKSSELTLTKLGKGFITTDTCSAAQKLRRDLVQQIMQQAIREGLNADQIVERFVDCWQHLRNVWFNGVNISLGKYISDVLEDDLKSLPPIFRVSIDVDDLFRCIEKKVGPTANYAKGDGALFLYWMKEYNPGAYLYPIARACGGTRQDLCVEGAPGVLMNLKLYLQFIRWRMCAVGGKGDNILATKLYIMLRSSEVVALLRVLSILHISICLPTRWLAGKSHELGDYDFGYYDMSTVLDCMEDAFEAILDDPELFLDEDFMLNQIFSSISEKVDPFREYITHMYEQKVTLTVSGINNDDLFYDDLRAALFYPTREDIIQTNKFCLELAVEAATVFLKEFRDTTKATHHYLSSIGGKYSTATITEDQRKASMGIEASNSIAESVHASSTHSLKLYGTIRIDSAAAEGQSRANNDFGRGHEAFVTSQKKKSTPTQEPKIGLFIKLPPELRETMVIAGKRISPMLRNQFDNQLKAQHEAKLKREKLAAAKHCENRGEAYIEAMDYIERWHSDRCWKTEEQAMTVWAQLGSEGARLKAIKEQITIRRKGTIGEEAGHKWSENGYHYTADELLDHFLNVILPMESVRPIPTEPIIELSAGIDDKYSLGTLSVLDIRDDRFQGKTLDELKQDAIKERERRESERETDRDAQFAIKSNAHIR
jgi:hypothetical protein